MPYSVSLFFGLKLNSLPLHLPMLTSKKMKNFSTRTPKILEASMWPPSCSSTSSEIERMNCKSFIRNTSIV